MVVLQLREGAVRISNVLGSSRITPSEVAAARPARWLMGDSAPRTMPSRGASASREVSSIVGTGNSTSNGWCAVLCCASNTRMYRLRGFNRVSTCSTWATLPSHLNRRHCAPWTHQRKSHPISTLNGRQRWEHQYCMLGARTTMSKLQANAKLECSGRFI
jgi:hypothetical protein